jgi:hypothetical protein
LCAVAWVGLVRATGGFQFHVGALVVSSRQPDNALYTALVAAVVLLVSARYEGREGLAREWAWWRRAPSSVLAWTLSHVQELLGAAPAVLALFVIGVQVYRWTGAEPLWIDEEAIALTVREHSFAKLAGPVWLGTSAPLGWLMAERAAILAGGAGEIALRFIPMWFGAGTLLTSVWIGRRWLNPPGALALVVLCAANRTMGLFWFEAKQYTADAFWALLLPALVVWAIEADDDGQRMRRAAGWWVTATIGQWLANGAAIVTPGCALILIAASWRLHRRAAWTIAAPGLIWVAGALLHYQFAMRYTLNSAYFYTYWAASFPPRSVGPTGALLWMFNRLPVLAQSPMGTGLWISLWILALLGLAFASNRALGAAFATVPLTAFALAGFRIVPFYERFVLWIAPALAVGVGLAVDRAARVAFEGVQRRSVARLAIGVVVAAGASRLCEDVIARGRYSFHFERPALKHDLDDRAAVRWLMAQRRPGDAILTTKLAWPAIWWYGDVPIGTDAAAHGRMPDGGAMHIVTAPELEPACTGAPLSEALRGSRRVLVYIGFPEFPDGFPDRLLRGLDELGSRTAFQRFGKIGQAAVVDLYSNPPTSAGCIAVQPAIPW